MGGAAGPGNGSDLREFGGPPSLSPGGVFTAGMPDSGCLLCQPAVLCARRFRVPRVDAGHRFIRWVAASWDFRRQLRKPRVDFLLDLRQLAVCQRDELSEVIGAHL